MTFNISLSLIAPGLYEIIPHDDSPRAIRTAFLDAAKNDPAAFDRLSDGKNRPWQTVDNAAYGDTIKLIQFVDRLRRQNG